MFKVWVPENTEEMKQFERGDDAVFTLEVTGDRYRNSGKRTEGRKGSFPPFLIPSALLGQRVENKNSADALLTTAHNSADLPWLTLSIFNKL